MKTFNIIFCLLFIISAALQYNDPDPYLWIPIYIIGAFFCFQASRSIFYPNLSIAVILIYTLYGVVLFFDKYGVVSWLKDHDAENIAATMKASKPWIEETREFFGLLILVVVLSINYFVSRKQIRINP